METETNVPALCHAMLTAAGAAAATAATAIATMIGIVSETASETVKEIGIETVLTGIATLTVVHLSYRGVWMRGTNETVRHNFFKTFYFLYFIESDPMTRVADRYPMAQLVQSDCSMKTLEVLFFVSACNGFCSCCACLCQMPLVPTSGHAIRRQSRPLRPPSLKSLPSSGTLLRASWMRTFGTALSRSKA